MMHKSKDFFVRLLATTLILLVAISGFYIPVLFFELPDDQNNSEGLLQYFKLANVGTYPWMLAFTIWQLLRLLSKSGREFPLQNPFDRSVVLTTLGIAVFCAFTRSLEIQTWKTEPVSFTEAIAPAISLVAFCMLLVFLGRLLNRIWPNMGLWILYTGIAVSGVGLTIRDHLTSIEAGAMTMKALIVAILLTVFGIVIAVFSTTYQKQNLATNAHPLFAAAILLITCKNWMYGMVQSYLNSSPENAIWFQNSSSLVNWALSVLLILIVGLLCWVRAFPTTAQNRALISFAAISALFLIDTYFLINQTPLLEPIESLVFASLALALFWKNAESLRQRSMAQAFGPKS